MFDWKPAVVRSNCPTPFNKIGHLRGDFGRSGLEFWTSWFDTRPELKTAAFRNELNDVVNHLRQDILKDFSTMRRSCRSGASLCDLYGRECYGFRMDTDYYSYDLRCIPVRNDYHFYLTCYTKEE